MSTSIGNSIGFSQYKLPRAKSDYVVFQKYPINTPLFVTEWDKFRTNFRKFQLVLSNPATEDKTFLIEGLTSNGIGRAREVITISSGDTTSDPSTNYYSNVSITPQTFPDANSTLSVDRLDGYVEFQHHAMKSTLYVSTGTNQSWTIKGAIWNTENILGFILNSEDLALLYFNINANLTDQLGTMDYPYYLEMPLGRMQVWSNTVDPGDEEDIIFQYNTRQLYT